jgi:hypothetical protein
MMEAEPRRWPRCWTTVIASSLRDSPEKTLEEALQPGRVEGNSTYSRDPARVPKTGFGPWLGILPGDAHEAALLAKSALQCPSSQIVAPRLPRPRYSMLIGLKVER